MSITFLGNSNNITKYHVPQIIFSEKIFSLDLNNVELRIENIHFIFLADFKVNTDALFPGCLLCFKGKENSWSVIKLQAVYIECFSNSSFASYQNDFNEYSLIGVDGYNFSINLEKIFLKIEKLCSFRIFLKIQGRIPHPENDQSFRTIHLKDFNYSGFSAQSVIKNSFSNINFSLESSNFINIITFRFDFIFSNIWHYNCSFSTDFKQKYSSTIFLGDIFLNIIDSKLNFQKSNYTGNGQPLANQIYIFILFVRSSVTLKDIIVSQIYITEVSSITQSWRNLKFFIIKRFLSSIQPTIL